MLSIDEAKPTFSIHFKCHFYLFTFHSLLDLFIRLAEPQHDGRLGDQVGVDVLGRLQHLQGLAVAVRGNVVVQCLKLQKQL